MARDVANILGISDPQTIIERLDDDEHGSTVILDARGIAQKTSILSEYGVYAPLLVAESPQQKISNGGYGRMSFRPSGSTAAHTRCLPRGASRRHSGLCADEKSTIRTSEGGPSVNVIDERGRTMCIPFGGDQIHSIAVLPSHPKFGATSMAVPNSKSSPVR